MKRFSLPQAVSTYVDTPQGIFTDAAIWFRTREASLKEYAGAVLRHRSLSQLLSDAAVWLRSPQTLALWLLPALLLLLNTAQAALTTLLVFLAWHTLGPSLVSRNAIAALRVLELAALQALVYVGALSWMAASDRITAVIVGLASFVLLRWGVLWLVLAPIVKVIRAPLYRMPIPDHVLRAVIVRAALHHRVTLADFSPIEKSITQYLERK